MVIYSKTCKLGSNEFWKCHIRNQWREYVFMHQVRNCGIEKIWGQYTNQNIWMIKLNALWSKTYKNKWWIIYLMYNILGGIQSAYYAQTHVFPKLFSYVVLFIYHAKYKTTWGIQGSTFHLLHEYSYHFQKWEN